MNEKRLATGLTVLLLLAIALCYLVIGMGAFTRLTDAGLGCPDWPACYGHWVVPKNVNTIAMINAQYQHSPLVAHKALYEMWHRYVAGVLGIVIAMISALGVGLSAKRGMGLFVLSLCLLAVLLYQVILGMWTVTLKLMPIVVTQHLLGGMGILSLLWLLLLHVRQTKHPIVVDPFLRHMRAWAVFVLILMVVQIALGAWTSSHYAGLVCHGLLTCQPAQVLSYEFKEAFQLFSMVGVNYEGGLLSDGARMTIQMTHRISAVVVLLMSVGLCVWIQYGGTKPDRNARASKREEYRAMPNSSQKSKLKKVSFCLVMLMGAQVLIGLANVWLQLPWVLSIAHNLVAATLLLTMVTLVHYLFVGARPTGTSY